MPHFPLLSILIWLPIGAGAGVLALAAAGVGARALKWIALAVAAAVFLLSLPLFFAFDASLSACSLSRIPNGRRASGCAIR